ncbi:putative cytochrome P450 oxidoreductase [Lophium mytilinum]|uniref:Putative cytochrome P450 oxidoreductase n=1 Tax=Lophium mytilinum TaxID=390894 RepID=A0A6A6R692_9PEZI|nr:putative cytochrome P450 oxidoreductase [Lophium mytilinum]
MTPTTLSIIIALLSYGVYRVLQTGKRDPRMPKGPPTLPIIGNLHQIPMTGFYKQLREWGKEYKGIYSLKFGSTNVIVCADRKSVHDMVDKKGLMYADRPFSHVGHMITGGDHMVLSSNDPLTREKRKVTTHNLSPRNIDEKVAPIQESEITQLMFDFLEKPEDFYKHLRRVTSSIACTLVFGQRGATYDSFWGSCVYEALASFGECLEPGANPPVDEFPIFKYWPARLTPWPNWQTRALGSRDCFDRIWGKAREFVEERRRSGVKRDCVADQLLDTYEAKGFPFSQHAVNMLLGEMVEGGAETTSSSLLTVVLALAINPQYQEKARKEIDAVCGTERSPTWTDFKDLPYVNCIVKEGMRYRPVISSGLPHRNNAEDTYEGMLIPKDSMIFVPAWALHHNENNGYEDPDTFNPDRFLNHPKLANDYAGSPDYNMRDHYGYGAGRRMCPGIHLAERNQFRMVSKLLWAFEIREPLNEKGERVPLDPEAYESGLLHAPLPFKCEIKVRSQAHVDTIRKEMAEARKHFAKWE